MGSIQSNLDANKQACIFRPSVPTKWINWYHICPIDNLEPPKWSRPIKRNNFVSLFCCMTPIHATSTITIIPAGTFGHDAKVPHIPQGAQRIGTEFSLGKSKGLPSLGCWHTALKHSELEVSLPDAEIVNTSLVGSFARRSPVWGNPKCAAPNSLIAFHCWPGTKWSWIVAV